MLAGWVLFDLLKLGKWILENEKKRDRVSPHILRGHVFPVSFSNLFLKISENVK